jgi:hypothetical protein
MACHEKEQKTRRSKGYPVEARVGVIGGKQITKLRSQPATPGGDLMNKEAANLVYQETNHQIISQQPRKLCSPPENKAGPQTTL